MSSLPPGRYSRPVPRWRTPLMWIAITVASVSLLLVGGWIVGGMMSDPVYWKTEGFSIVDASRVDVAFQVTKEADATVTCTIEALNASYAQVGVTEVTIGPEAGSASQHTATVATDQLAVTGQVATCTLVQP